MELLKDKDDIITVMMTEDELRILSEALAKDEKVKMKEQIDQLLSWYD